MGPWDFGERNSPSSRYARCRTNLTNLRKLNVLRLKTKLTSEAVAPGKSVYVKESDKLGHASRDYRHRLFARWSGNTVCMPTLSCSPAAFNSAYPLPSTKFKLQSSRHLPRAPCPSRKMIRLKRETKRHWPLQSALQRGPGMSWKFVDDKVRIRVLEKCAW